MRILGAVLATVLVLSATTTAAEADEPSDPVVAAPTEPSPAVEEPAAPAPAVALGATAYTGYLGTTVAVAGSYSGADGAVVRLARLDGSTWVPLAAAVTQADGAFSSRVPVDADTSQVRAELLEAGSVVTVSDPAVVTGSKAATTLQLSLPSKVTDYRSVTMIARWRTVDGRKPTGTVDLMFRDTIAKTWTRYRTLPVTNGRFQTTLKPRRDGRFELRFAGSSTLKASRSASKPMDNRPPGKAVSLPKGASRPSVRLPAQKRAARAEADATISRIPDSMWTSMKGRSWHSGCPVGRSSLRVVRVSYWGFDGYVRRGEIVVAARHSKATARLFTALFAQKAPIRSMYRVDRFGWSKKLNGADDYTSMKADNTSGFNCRRVVGNSSRRSPHSSGKAIDINPWENPYASPEGWYPNQTWQQRKKPAAVTYRGKGDPVVKAFRKQGFRWLGGFDLQHFER